VIRVVGSCHRVLPTESGGLVTAVRAIGFRSQRMPGPTRQPCHRDGAYQKQPCHSIHTRTNLRTGSKILRVSRATHALDCPTRLWRQDCVPPAGPTPLPQRSVCHCVWLRPSVVQIFAGPVPLLPVGRRGAAAKGWRPHLAPTVSPQEARHRCAKVLPSAQGSEPTAVPRPCVNSLPSC